MSDILILRNSSITERLYVNDLGIDLGPEEYTNLITNFENASILDITIFII